MGQVSEKWHSLVTVAVSSVLTAAPAASNSTSSIASAATPVNNYPATNSNYPVAAAEPITSVKPTQSIASIAVASGGAVPPTSANSSPPPTTTPPQPSSPRLTHLSMRRGEHETHTLSLSLSLHC